MESEVVHSPSETPGGISSRGMQFPAWRRASSTRARFFLIWFCKTRAQKIARGYSDSGELGQHRAGRGRGFVRQKHPQLQQAAVPVTTFGHLCPCSSPISAGVWGLSRAEPAWTAQTHSLPREGSSVPGGRVWAGGSPGCGCTSCVLRSCRNFGTVTPPGHPLAPTARAGSHPAGATKGASPPFLLLI